MTTKNKLPSGWLVLDKPLALSSNDALVKVRGKLRTLWGERPKIGHAGTLDPLASGILPLAIGEATKLIPYAVDRRKTYIFEVTWGEERTTDDAEGEVTQSSPKRPLPPKVEAFLPSFLGHVSQMPPAYSALKVEGKRACDLLREGKEVTLQAREVTIYDLQILTHTPALTRFEMTTGPGAYVRSVGRDLGRLLGCYGYVSFLRRIRVGPFEEKNALTLEKVLAMQEASGIEKYLKCFDYVLDDIPALILEPDQVDRLTKGQRLALQVPPQSVVLCKTRDGKPIALASIENGVIIPKRVFTI